MLDLSGSMEPSITPNMALICHSGEGETWLYRNHQYQREEVNGEVIWSNVGLRFFKDEHLEEARDLYLSKCLTWEKI